MAASLHDNSLGLTFGAPTNADVVLQNVEATRSTQTAEVADEDGDIIGLAIFGGTKQEISGEAVWKGDDIGTLGAAVTITGITSPGAVFLTEMADKWTNTGFRTQSFKAISVEGIN